MATYGKLKEFDSTRENWINYVERLELFFTANDIDDATKKKAIFLSASGSETYALCRNLCAPANPSAKSYDELKTLLKNHLQPTPNPIAERFKFNTRYKQVNENVSQYVAALRQLTEHCDYGTTVETMLRDRLVCGINDSRIQKRLLSEGSALTYTRALELSLSLEAAEKNSTAIQGFTNTPKTEVTPGSSEVYQMKNVPERSKACHRCGATNHKPDACHFKNQECFHCHLRGHISKVCWKKKNSKGNLNTRGAGNNHVRLMEAVNHPGNNHVRLMEEVTHSDEGSDDEVLNLYVLTEKRTPPLIANVRIAGTDVHMEIDTGASLTVMSKETYDNVFTGDQRMFEPFQGTIKTYTGERITPLGKIIADVEYGNQRVTLPIVILKANGPTLFGRNWLNSIILDWNELLNIQQPVTINHPANKLDVEQTKLNEILEEYKEVFEKSIGTLKNTTVRIKMKNDAVPKFYKARPVPYAMKDRIDKELDRMVQQGIYKAVDVSEWAAPIVPVVKKDGDVRICGDYKVTVNKECIRDNYPIPKTEDLFASLTGGEKFTKLERS